MQYVNIYNEILISTYNIRKELLMFLYYFLKTLM